MKHEFFSRLAGFRQEQTGDLPLRHRSQRGAGLIEVLVAVVILILLVQLFQSVGTWLSKRCDKRLKH